MTAVDANSLRARLARRWRFILANLDRRNFNATLLQSNAALAPGAAPRLAFFNHFDAQGQVAGYVLHHLQALVTAGHAIVFITTAPRLDAAALQSLAPLCWLVAQRRNIGLDIGGWPCAMRVYERHSQRRLADASRVLVTNDSIFGPLQALPPLLERMSAQGADVWGVTESAERGLHLQSYFLVFERRGPAFLAGWLRRFRFDPERDALIARHEIGLSAAARAAGLHLTALQTHAALKARVDAGTSLATADALARYSRRSGGINPTHYFWRVGLEHFGCPYIKRDLVRDYTRFDDGLEPWPQVLARVAPAYPGALVSDYFAAIAPVANRPA